MIRRLLIAWHRMCLTRAESDANLHGRALTLAILRSDHAAITEFAEAHLSAAKRANHHRARLEALQ